MLMATREEVVAARRRNLKHWIDEHHEGAQSKFIEKTGINQGELSGLLKEKSFGEKKARALEDAAGMPPLYLDNLTGIEGIYSSVSQVRTIYEDVNSEFVPIRRLDMKISAGISGFALEFFTEDRPPIFFRRDWLERKGYDQNKLFAVPVTGQSMEPSLWEGDVVVINSADTARLDAEVYAFNYEGEVVIKRLVREAGQWYLSSDNPDKRRYPNKICDENCIMIGKIVYRQSERI